MAERLSGLASQGGWKGAGGQSPTLSDFVQFRSPFKNSSFKALKGVLSFKTESCPSFLLVWLWLFSAGSSLSLSALPRLFSAQVSLVFCG